MPAAIVTSPGALDQTGEALFPFFGDYQSDGLISDPFWYCRLIEEGAGSEPGTCEIVLNNEFTLTDQPANLAWNPDNLWFQKIKFNTAVRVWRKFMSFDQDGNITQATKLMFTGRVDIIDQGRDHGRDQIIISASDARTEFRKVRICGRVACTAGGSTPHYQDGWPAHFNPGGRPNCIFDAKGRPWFAPYPDYGLDPATGENPPDAKQKDVSQACYWTLGNIMLYLRNVYGPDATARNDFQSDLNYFPYVSQLPSWIIWDEKLGSGLDYESVANFDNGVGQNNSQLGSARKGRDLNLSGLWLGGEPGKEGAFDMIFATAGGWNWTLQYGLDNNLNITNTLALIPQTYNSQQKAVDIPYAAGGDASTTLKYPIAMTGTIRESSRDMISRVVGRGGMVKIETRLATKNDLYTSGNGLLAAWTPTRFLAFSKLACDLGNGTPTELTITEAAARYPEVMTTVQLDGNFAFQAGTEYAGWPQLQIPRPIWPFLLSYQGGASGARDSITKPYPIRVEVDTNGSGNWVIATEFTGLEILDNGQIYLPTLRDLPLLADSTKPGIWRWTHNPMDTIATGDPAHPKQLDITLNNIRFTMAVPCDHRLVYALRCAFDQTPMGFCTQASFDINNECPDSDRFAPGFSRAAFLELSTLYQQWIQSPNAGFESYPIPATAYGPSEVVSPQTNQNLRNDRPLLQSHVRRDLRQKFRLNRDGSVLRFPGTFMTGYRPGTMIRNLLPLGNAGQTPYPAKSVVYRRRFTSQPTGSMDGTGAPTFENRTDLLLI